MPRIALAGLYASCMFWFLRNCQTDSQSTVPFYILSRSAWVIQFLWMKAEWEKGEPALPTMLACYRAFAARRCGRGMRTLAVCPSWVRLSSQTRSSGEELCLLGIKIFFNECLFICSMLLRQFPEFSLKIIFTNLFAKEVGWAPYSAILEINP